MSTHGPRVVPSPRVLVVDDEPFNLDLLCQELDEIGIDARCATNGREALRAIDEHDCDLVLLDVMMPEMDGREVLARLGEAGRLAELPVIVVSAIDDVTQAAACIELGAEDYLTKPFDPVLLRARIEGALEKKRLRDQVARQLEATRRLFGRYVPEQIARSILDSGGELEPVYVEATVLYTDIAGFTGIVEGMAPAEVMLMLNEYFEAVLDPIRRHGGVVNQFQGDALLVTFNIPVPDPHHRERAVYTASEIQVAVRSRRFAGQALPTRIGVNTGMVIAGNVGTGDRLHYTVHGDTVNVAARLEALNKIHGTHTLLSSTTVENLGPGFNFERIGNVQVRGKDRLVSAYTLPDHIDAGAPL